MANQIHKADWQGHPFDPRLPVIIKFSEGAKERIVETGLNDEGFGFWSVPEVPGIIFNSRGVAVVSEHGEIQRPWKWMAVNVMPPANWPDDLLAANDDLVERQKMIDKHMSWRHHSQKEPSPKAERQYPATRPKAIPPARAQERILEDGQYAGGVADLPPLW